MEYISNELGKWDCGLCRLSLIGTVEEMFSWEVEQPD